jgi:D-glycero-alpha-D-manno-heptose 1-phosphate guanylyltransferase
MQLLILAGGFGTRLKGVTGDTPKVLAPICNLPFLHYQIENWVNQGVTSFIFLLHYQAETIIKYLKAEVVPIYNKCEFSWVIEISPRGTGGAILNGIEHMHITDSFLVINADTWLGTGIKELIYAGPQSMAVTEFEDPARYGSIEIDSESRVIDFYEKSEVSTSKLINAGLYHFTPDVFLNTGEGQVSLESSILPSLVKKNELLGIKLSTDFIDIGVPEDYARFDHWIDQNRKGQLWN